MAYPMIALTTDGTAFACASVSLTETGLAVLDENGSRIGFVPYDSLEYVAPTEESQVKEAPMQVLVEDGSSFGAASVSQAAKGVAVLDESGSRIGFVPYDTLTHVLPESKTGPTLPADATPLATVNVDEEDDGGGPVWKGDEERAATDEDADDEQESDDGADSNIDRSGNDNDSDPHPNVDRSGNDNDSDPHPTPDEDADAEDESEAEPDDETASAPDDGERDVGTDDDGPVWGGEPEERSERGDDVAEDGSESAADEEGDTEPSGDDAAAGDDASGAGDGERDEEAEESELVVEWSFGDE